MADMTVAIEMGAGDDIGKQVADLSTAMNKVSEQFGGVGGRGSISGVFESLEDLNRELDKVKQQAKQGNIAMGPAQVTQTASGGYSVQAELRARQPNEKWVAGLNELRDGLTSMVPGGSIINSFEKSGMFVGMMTGIVAIGMAMKSVVQSSQVWGTMIGTVMKTLSVVVDVFLAPFMPFVAKIAMWIIQHIMPKMANMGEWLSNLGGGAGGLGLAVGAGVVGYLALKAGASLLGNMGASIGTSMLTKFLGGKAGETLGGNAATALSKGLIIKRVGSILGGAISSAITLTKSAAAAIGTTLSSGFSTALTKFPLLSKIMPMAGPIGVLAIAAAMGYTMWRRYKQVQQQDDVTKGMSKTEELRYLMQMGVGKEVAQEYQVQNKFDKMGSSVKMVETFQLFQSMTDSMAMMGQGFEGIEMEFQEAFKLLGPKWKEFFRDTFLPNSQMMATNPDMVKDIQNSLWGIIADSTEANAQALRESGVGASVMRGTFTGERVMDPATGLDIRPERNQNMIQTLEADLRRFGITAQQANIYHTNIAGGLSGIMDFEKRSGGRANTPWANLSEQGFSPGLISSPTGVANEVKIYLIGGEEVEDEVYRYLRERAEHASTSLGNALTLQVDSVRAGAGPEFS